MAKMKLPKDLIASLLKLGGGAVLGNIGINQLKKIQGGKFEKFAPVIVAVIGGVVSGNKKMQMVGYGMMATGTAKAVGNFVPSLAGIEDMDLSGIFDGIRIGEMDGTLNGEYDMAGAAESLNGVEGDYDMSGYDNY